MRKEILLLTEQLQDAYEGEPWFGRNVKQLLAEADQENAFIKLNNQHSIVELVWHMITWREFTINCVQKSSELDLKYFEELDWREIDHTNQSLWSEGLKKLEETQNKLVFLLQEQDDSILEQKVSERNYNYRKLLNGIIQHDIYHLGQIAYITKQLKNS
ncbi:MAG: DinB family protein [Chitinophagaceae bacterium]|nr:MAG: DinB family protein [Chitinophagaceae bacterium]